FSICASNSSFTGMSSPVPLSASSVMPTSSPRRLPSSLPDALPISEHQESDPPKEVRGRADYRSQEPTDSSRWVPGGGSLLAPVPDRKSTRLNSSHGSISYAVFCLNQEVRRRLVSAGKAIHYTLSHE